MGEGAVMFQGGQTSLMGEGGSGVPGGSDKLDG